MESLELDGHAVVGGLDFDLPALPGHVFSQMRQDEAAAVEVVAVFPQFFQAQVEVEFRVVERALADEEVAFRDLKRQIIEPSRVTGVGDLLSPESNAVAVGVRFRLVLGREGFDLGGTGGETLTGMDLPVVDRKRPLTVVEVVTHCRGECVHAGLNLWRPHDLDRMGAGIRVERRVQERGNSAEMISVKMRDQDDVDLVSRDFELRQSGVRRAATIEEHPASLAPGKDGGLTTTAGAEGVAGSDEDDFAHSGLPLADSRQG